MTIKTNKLLGELRLVPIAVKLGFDRRVPRFKKIVSTPPVTPNEAEDPVNELMIITIAKFSIKPIAGCKVRLTHT